MSRIGRKPIVIPAGVTVKIENNTVAVKGPKGSLSTVYSADVSVKQEGNTLLVERHDDAKYSRAQHGLYRSLIGNTVKGVSDGFEKRIIVNGVGYKCSVQGKKLVMNIGYSHPVEVEPPEGITFEAVTTGIKDAAIEIVVKGIDKHLVGQIAANIKAARPVEPYHLYGLRYKDEVVVQKEGKTSK